LDLWSSS